MPDRTIVENTMVRRVVGYLDRRGLDWRPLLAEAGISEAILQGPPGLMTFGAAMRLYEVASRRLNLPTLGLSIAQQTEARDYGLTGLIWAHHPTILAALEALSHYYNLFFANARIHVFRGPHTTRVQSTFAFDTPGLEVFRPEVLASIYRHAHATSDVDWVPVAMRLRQAEHHPDHFREAFRVNVQFGAEEDELELPNEALLRPNQKADPLLLQQLLQAAETQVVRRRQLGEANARTLELVGCTVDLQSGMVLRQGTSLPLTTKERALLEYLAHRRNQTVTHHDIEHDVWGMGRSVISHAPAVAIRRLRQKIEPSVRKPVNLVTVFGEGWKLVVP